LAKGNVPVAAPIPARPRRAAASGIQTGADRGTLDGMSDRFPMSPYPTGWFAVAYSDELKPGAVLPARYFGEELAIYRAASGAPRVLGGFCPHLGAHLGYGGCVEGETIACPFHKWRFDGAGTCVEIPYAKKIPPKARTRSWPARDLNGFIMVHHS